MSTESLTAQGYVSVSYTYGDIIEANQINFGVNDNKGREIGCRTCLRPQTISLVSETVINGSSIAKRDRLGDWFCAFVQKTKNGEDFGARQDGKEFRTIEEARAYIEKRVAASRKAAK
jgi:hypothetical protein